MRSRNVNSVRAQSIWMEIVISWPKRIRSQFVLPWAYTRDCAIAITFEKPRIHRTIPLLNSCSFHRGQAQDILLKCISAVGISIITRRCVFYFRNDKINEKLLSRDDHIPRYMAVHVYFTNNLSWYSIEDDCCFGSHGFSSVFNYDIDTIVE